MKEVEEYRNTPWSRIPESTNGPAEVEHLDPSDIALYSVELPHDGSALHSHRGAGIPNEWIDDYQAHMMSPIQYHSLSISYANEDGLLAHHLYADLQDKAYAIGSLLMGRLVTRFAL